MRFFGKYLKLQFKRTARVYVIILALMLVLFTVIASVGLTMLKNSENDESRQRIKVGIVGDKDDKFLNMGITMLQTIDVSNLSVEFFSFNDENDAIKAMENQTINTYVYVPADFGKKLWRSEDVKLTYVMAKSGASVSTLLTRDILNVVSNYIVKTQKGVTAMCNYAEDNGYTYEQVDEIDVDMSIEYIDLIVKREALAEINETGLGGSLSFVGYYICGFTVFFLLCFGITCCPLKVKKNNSLDKLLYSRGCGAFSQSIAEYLPYFAISFITLFIPFAVVGFASGSMDFGVAELEYFILSDYLAMPFKLIPVILVITAFQILMYELVSGVINSVLLQFTVAIILGYISGCFYPIYFLPQVVQNVSSVLPLRVAMEYFGVVLCDNADSQKLAVCLIYAVVLFALSVIIRKIKIQKSEGQ